MGRTILKQRRKLVCPACNARVHFLAVKDNLGTCPRCGKWLISKRNWRNHRLERLDCESYTDFDESNDCEQSLLDGSGQLMRDIPR